ncbi:putative phosphoglycerate mutase [Trypanosoma cruzi]|uniref:Phosphoglycerate mutase, putative n=1 Tax=Trypanosoma cruzi (strain CL Brener) TaxID=353153 RepID=Q4CYT5_TRYCC|nr:phosphoglycerate mutase, putative [Trypanosoma cruzi]EAN85442.1 phosphoglycerate mutase, putative [Trypanosoma cruzi]RNC61813.1 putative phosphoglycerate mutase [Trypanosoma cruzi]|eukprot:XP_807293.1 phosphoglycerate mutase [Trypanosoma cruzi strain CL Brener]
MIRRTLRRFVKKSNLSNLGTPLASKDSEHLAGVSSTPSTSLPEGAEKPAVLTHTEGGGKMSITIRSDGFRRSSKIPTAIAEPVKRIIFVRSGKSLADLDINTYVTTPDWRISIVPEGEEESYQAGRHVAEMVGDEPVYFYFSPYLRSRQSFRHVLRGYDDYRSEQKMDGDSIIGVREDVRLRDVDIGRYRSKEELLHHLREREVYGRFYYRFPYGESGADVCDRVTSFLDAFQRERLDFPMDTNVVIVTHGQTIRMFVKRWFHLTVETYHLMESPPTGSVSTLTRLHHRSCFRLDGRCVEWMNLPLSLNEYNGYKYRNKQLLGSMSTGAPFM